MSKKKENSILRVDYTYNNVTRYIQTFSKSSMESDIFHTIQL